MIASFIEWMKRKVRTPKGSMPCRIHGRIVRKCYTTDSVSENIQPKLAECCVYILSARMEMVKRRDKSPPPQA